MGAGKGWVQGTLTMGHALTDSMIQQFKEMILLYLYMKLSHADICLCH